MGISEVFKTLESQRGSSIDHRGLGGCEGGGFCTPVTSYPPRPMFIVLFSLSIMESFERLGVQSLSAGVCEEGKSLGMALMFI